MKINWQYRTDSKDKYGTDKQSPPCEIRDVLEYRNDEINREIFQYSGLKRDMDWVERE
jgi:hypothetical protein